MKSVLEIAMAVGLASCVPLLAFGQSAKPDANAGICWHGFPDDAKFQVLGLHWFEGNESRLWRLSANGLSGLPMGVQNRAKFPSGGRILLRCNSTRLALRAKAADGRALKTFDTYVNGTPCKPQVESRQGVGSELKIFVDLDDQQKEILIYLPHTQEIQIEAIGVDPDTVFMVPVHEYAQSLPMVFYGSSVCQGSGATHPGQTYPAILGRELNLDIVNLGFGGAGKAESNVVEVVDSIAACCYLFDLGKSYGLQDAKPFRAMLQKIRESHAEIPIIVVTPITSAKELNDRAYSDQSLHTRSVMRWAVKEQIESGDRWIYLVEGEELLGFADHKWLSSDGVHPSDVGYQHIATKLRGVVKTALSR